MHGTHNLKISEWEFTLKPPGYLESIDYVNCKFVQQLYELSSFISCYDRWYYC